MATVGFNARRGFGQSVVFEQRRHTMSSGRQGPGVGLQEFVLTSTRRRFRSSDWGSAGRLKAEDVRSYAEVAKG